MPVIEKNFDRSELIAIVSAETGFDRDVVERIFEKAIDTLITQTCLRGYSEFHGLGSFRVKEHAPLSGKTPQGQDFSVGKRLSIDFNAALPFRSELEALTETPVIP